MSYPIESRRGDLSSAPRAGKISAFSVSMTAGSIDLRTIGTTSTASAAQTGKLAGIQDRFVTLQATGAAVYINVGATQGAVTGGNAPLASATGSNAAQGCAVIPDGGSLTFYAVGGVDIWVGYVTLSGTATLRVWESSP